MSKIYVGNAKVINTDYGQMLKVSLHRDNVNDIVKWMKENDSDWCNIDVKKKREPKEGKPPYYLEINEYKRESNGVNNGASNGADEPNEDLPF